MKPISFTTILTFDKLKFNINAVYYPDPPDDIDLYDITFAGKGLTQKQEDELIQAYGWKQFNTWLLNKGRGNYECLKCWRHYITKKESCRFLNMKKTFNEHGNQCPFFTTNKSKESKS